MADKITIRRVGGLLPAFCLVVLILLVGLVVWLSTAGLPGCALRQLEEAAAQEGIYLRLGKLKFFPASGLAMRAYDVEVYAAAGDNTPLATLERATLGISAGALLRGRVQPTIAKFRNLNAALPTDGDAPLRIEGATVTTSIRQGRNVRITSATAWLEGIPVTLRGGFTLPEQQETSPDSEPLDLVALLSPWKAEVGCLQRAIASQQWAPNELPRMELRLMAMRRTQLSARITIPRYDEGQFHFRDASLNVSYQNNTLLINKIHFRTVDPDSEVTLQGGYDIPARHLSLHLESTAALTRMAEAISIPGVNMEQITAWLKRFRHPDDAPPSISLRGDLSFEEDFSPKAISFMGQLNQKDFTFGQTAVNELGLSFFYRDGSFNIDRLQLVFPTGSLTASASASSDTHKGKARLMADLDIPQLLQFASEFTSEPLTLPEGLQLTGNLLLDASAELDMPAFISGSTKLSQFLPSLHRVELSLAIDKASHCGYSMEQPRLTLKLSPRYREGEEGMIPHEVAQASLDFQANSISIPPGEGKETGTTLHQAALALNLHDLSLEEGSEHAPHSPLIGSAAGHLRVGALTLPGLSIAALEAELSDTTGIRPLAEDWRRMLQQATFRLNTGAMHSGDVLLGALDSKVQLAAEGKVDIAAVLNREGQRLYLDLHPQLMEDGVLVLEQVRLELPAAGFEPLLALAGADITQIRLPDILMLSGNASYDTQGKYLRHAEAELSIPLLIRTPGDGVAAFKGKEVPLTLHARGRATGQKGGSTTLDGTLSLIHKQERQNARPRELHLSFRGNTESHLHLEGTSTLDVGTADQLIDLRSAHAIMRDFDTPMTSTTDIDIRAVDINWASGLTVTASCDVRLAGIGYQINAFEDELAADGTPTGRESLRKDFGKDPFRRVEKGTAHVDVLYKENASGKVEATRISILHADLTFNNRPWLRSQGFREGTPLSRLQGDAVIIDVEDSFVELRNVHGSAYPAYAIGAFYDDLPEFLETLILRQPAQLETQHCLFPIFHDCPHTMSGCIRILADEAGFHFLGTTFPLSSLSGFVWFRKGAVCLDRLNAACWDGAINAGLVIDYSGKRTGFDGFASLRNINLQPLAAAYGSQQRPALCNADIRFRTPTPDIDDLQAYGDLHIVNGDLMSLSLFQPVGALISDLPANLAALEREALNSEDEQPSWLNRQITNLFQKTGDTLGSVGSQINKVANNIPFANHFLRYDLQEVHSGFTIGNGRLVTEGMQALGYNLDVGVQLEIDLNQLTLDGELWPKISSVPTIILSPITFLSNFVIDIQVYGPLDDIQWRFGLNRKRKGSKDACSVTTEQQNTPMKPKKP